MNYLVFYLLSIFKMAQQPQTDTLVIPQNYFINPVDVPMTIVGNFGEPRKSHFHMGLDFRTNGEENHKIFAAADGYISRINVNSAGYGKALYITHPNGFVTVYAHLNEFSPAIQAHLRQEQYARESFKVDFNPKPGELVVKQGEQIALSGNTGGSGGPHLHFEIRDKLERVYNPMLFDYKLKDDKRPHINFIRFYPMDKLKLKASSFQLALKGLNGTHHHLPMVLLNDTKVGFSVNTFDNINLSEASIGIYSMSVYDGDKLVYNYKADRMSFSENRYVQSHVDYPSFLYEGRKSYHKCFVEPGNHCPVYDNLIDSGTIDLSDNKPHSVLIEVSDFAGNVSTVKFAVRHDPASTAFKPVATPFAKLFDPMTTNNFVTPEVVLDIPEGRLYDYVYFNHSATVSQDSTIFSKVHQLGNYNTFAQDYMNIALKTEGLPLALQAKALIVYKDKSGSLAPRGGTYENGMVKSKTRDFGTYFIKLDTTAPMVKSLNIQAGKSMRTTKKLVFSIKDDLSGIADFDTYLNGAWVVADYDAKSNSVVYKPDSSLPTGKYTFKIIVVDERKNIIEKAFDFLW